MRRLLLFAFWCSLALLGACGGKDSPQAAANPFPELSDKPVSPRLPYLNFYDTDAKQAIMRFETEAGGAFDLQSADAGTMGFESPDKNYPRTEYRVKSSRLLLTVSLYGSQEEDVRNTRLLEYLVQAGFVVENYSDVAVRLNNVSTGVAANVMRITADGRSLIRFTPLREQPSLPPLERRLIHPFHTIGASVEQIYAAELSEGRNLHQAEAGRLYLTFPEEGTLFDRFGFFIDNGTLYKVMSILLDGSYLDSDEFLDQMQADGFLFERRQGSFRYFRTLDKSVVVRAANAAPYPTIEYLDPRSEEAK